ncbi:hypothetical protein GCM10028820_18170 [Tessaracoccus terricola]
MALGYALSTLAMPALILGAVPKSEKSAANGLSGRAGARLGVRRLAGNRQADGERSWAAAASRCSGAPVTRA